MKKTCLFLSAVILGVVCSCGPDQNAESAGRKKFKVPDSLNDHLLIATFYEEDPAGHMILRYDNESRKSGKVIKFFESNEVYSQTVVPITDTKFMCADNNTEYEVFDKTVTAQAGGTWIRHIGFASLPQEKEFKRTD